MTTCPTDKKPAASGRAVEARTAAFALLACAAVLAWALQLRRADLSVPFAYSGDALFHAALAKGMADNGWYLHNRFLGMPAGQDLNDWPLADGLHLGLLRLLLLVTPNYAAALNLLFLLSFPLAVLTALYVFRQLGVSRPAAAACSLLFAFLPYHFQRSVIHPFLACYYTVPLGVLLALRVLLREGYLFRPARDRGAGIARRSRETLSAFTICLAVAQSGVYYAAFAAFLVLVAGALAAGARREARPALAAGLLAATIAAGSGSLALAAAAAYQRAHGPNPEVIARAPCESEAFGLRLTQLLLPATGHRIPALARLKQRYNASAPFVNENDSAALGVVASLGFLALLAGLVSGAAGGRPPTLFGGLCALNGAAVLLATTGGLGGLASFLLFPTLRSYTRMSIVIAFLALCCAGLGLDALRRRLSPRGRGALVGAAAVAAVLAAGLADQVGTGTVPPYAAIRRAYASDEEIVRRAEGAVPAGAMVFQLPYQRFPEPAQTGLPPYEHLRLYLHSHSLRWSGGAVAGRECARWQKHTAGLPPKEMLDEVRRAGFAAVCIARRGFPDSGAALIRSLEDLLGARPLAENDDWVLFRLAAEGEGSMDQRVNGRGSSH